MASIDIKGFGGVAPQTVDSNLHPTVVHEDTYKYKDIKFDIEYGMANDTASTDRNTGNIDIKDLRDIEAIKASLFNLFSTLPGQKLLNPYYGLNLASYCFDPVTQITADHIARTIIIEVPKHEPRIKITNLSVVGDVANGAYEITFGLYIPDYEADVINIKGIINSDRFKFIS